MSRNPKIHHAYNQVMDELRERIKSHSSSRLHRQVPAHKEPDGDESAEGHEYPGSPDDMTPVENVRVTRKDYGEDVRDSSECRKCGRSEHIRKGVCHYCGTRND
jgi:hypothetical protein